MVAERGLLIAESLSTRQMGKLYQDISTHNMDPHLYSDDKRQKKKIWKLIKSVLDFTSITEGEKKHSGS